MATFSPSQPSSRRHDADDTAQRPGLKHILHRLDTGWTIHSHLRMEGSWRIERAGPPPPPSIKLRAVLGTVDYRALGWSLGMLDVLATRVENTVVGHLGADLLGPSVTLRVDAAGSPGRPKLAGESSRPHARTAPDDRAVGNPS